MTWNDQTEWNVARSPILSERTKLFFVIVGIGAVILCALVYVGLRWRAGATWN